MTTAEVVYLASRLVDKTASAMTNEGALRDALVSDAWLRRNGVSVTPSDMLIDHVWETSDVYLEASFDYKTFHGTNMLFSVTAIHLEVK